MRLKDALLAAGLGAFVAHVLTQRRRVPESSTGEVSAEVPAEVAALPPGASEAGAVATLPLLSGGGAVVPAAGAGRPHSVVDWLLRD